jgi:tetratricopeptide (TPR) repeat protein
MVLLAAAPAAALASRGGSMPTSPMPDKTPEQKAADDYNSGLKCRDKAVKYLKEAKEAADEKDKGQLEHKAQKEFDKAIDRFRDATKLNPRFHQAYSDLGFCLRKTGDYNAALDAYGKALSLSPGYNPAIEYRAEAYLGLNRIEEAKQAYLQLFPADRGHADELLDAMKTWVEKRHLEPGDLAPGVVHDFETWVAQRDELARQTPTVSELQKRKW